MDHEIFLKRLQELAEIKFVRVPKTGATREAREPDLIYRGGQEFEISVDHNPTLNLVVKKLKPCIKNCEDCGRKVRDRVVNKALYSFPVKHWRRHCSSCDSVWNPQTGCFDIDFRSAQPFFTSLLRNRDK